MMHGWSHRPVFYIALDIEPRESPNPALEESVINFTVSTRERG